MPESQPIKSAGCQVKLIKRNDLFAMHPKIELQSDLQEWPIIQRGSPAEWSRVIFKNEISFLFFPLERS